MSRFKIDLENDMELQLIYTYEVTSGKEQDIINYKCWDKDIFESVDTFMEWVNEQLTDEEITELIKISTCVYNVGDFPPPDWYLECDGKIYPKDLVLN